MFTVGALMMDRKTVESRIMKVYKWIVHYIEMQLFPHRYTSFQFNFDCLNNCSILTKWKPCTLLNIFGEQICHTKRYLEESSLRDVLHHCRKAILKLLKCFNRTNGFHLVKIVVCWRNKSLRSSLSSESSSCNWKWNIGSVYKSTLNGKGDPESLISTSQ